MNNFNHHAAMLALLLGPISTSLACSVPGHHTSEDLVRDSQSIVLARVIEGTHEHFDNPEWESVELLSFLGARGPGPQVTFEVVKTLKGLPPRQRFNLVGSLKYFGANTGKSPYKAARPGAQRGLCFAYDYKLGGTFLLFLKNGSPYWSAVRPTNEEVRGSLDPWLLWVEAQIKRNIRPPNKEP